VDRTLSRVTINKVAEAADVSTATVSKVLNHASRGFSKATEKRVRDAIRSMSWIPNEDAQKLGRQNSRKRRKRRPQGDGEMS